jgi:hypothetical protein
MSPQYQRQRSKEQIFPTAPQMAARINAYSSDDKTTRDVAFWGETHRMTVILITHGETGFATSSWIERERANSN